MPSKAEWERRMDANPRPVESAPSSSHCYPSVGSETGLYDSNGKPIRVGDKVKTEVTGDTDYHGDWAVYEVSVRGMVPVLLYVTSEKGDKFPRGYTGCALSDKYDPKMFLWGTDLANVTPYEDMTILDG